ncbi:ribosome maturation factor RimM [Candidatus Karelsulcia muelleri]|uniref:hypothetical protein n=1 Tax=Candidatus Karelsulcia muelleri TaxID=336810 RepID=UPI000D7CF2EC|nr:hypothetical protein [Candidatus Karelsulcia muelleri]
MIQKLIFNKKKYFFLGKITKKHGLNFKKWIFLKNKIYNKKNFFKKLNLILIKKENFLLKLKINKIIFVSHTKLLLVNNNLFFKNLKNENLFLKKKQFFFSYKEEFLFHEIIDYKLFNNKYCFIGKIKTIYYRFLQNLLELNFNKKKYFLPLVKDFFLKKNQKKKILILKLPKGLLNNGLFEVTNK